MDYNTFVKNLSERVGQTQVETKRLLKNSFELITETIDNDKGISVPGLGTFHVKIRDEHKGYSPYHDQFMLLPKKRIVTFHPSSAIKEQLKNIGGGDGQ